MTEGAAAEALLKGRSLDDLKAELLANPAVRAEYEDRAAAFEIAAEVIAARIRAGLSRAQSDDAPIWE